MFGPAHSHKNIQQTYICSLMHTKRRLFILNEAKGEEENLSGGIDNILKTDIFHLCK